MIRKLALLVPIVALVVVGGGSAGAFGGQAQALSPATAR